MDKKIFYKKFATVSINERVASDDSVCNKCNKNLQEFSIFIGDEQRLSTLYSFSCGECLSKVVKEAIEQGKKDAENMIKRAEERELMENVKKYNL